MKSILYIFLILSGLSLISSTDYFDYSYTATAEYSPLKSIKNQYDKDFATFSDKVNQLNEAAKSPLVTDKQLQQAITDARLAYKRIEYLLEYLDPEATLRYINGAPLPKVEPHAPEITIINPGGLQTLDEIIYLEGSSEINEIKRIAADLTHQVKTLAAFHKNATLEHRYIIEAIRYGVLRVFTLGITGFDTPGSANALPEATVSLQTMRDALSKYNQIKASSNIEDILAHFDNAIHTLQNNKDFKTFDRLAFYRNDLRPIYTGLLEFHKKSSIELKKDIDLSNSPHNYMEENIFDENFFNLSYYTQIADSDLQNEKIRNLGKILFYDTSLSSDFKMSCASCHDPLKGFTDGLPKSKTNKTGKFTKRNSPTMLNAAVYGRYFYDMREYDLERQIKHVAADSLEFNHDLLDMADRLLESDEYSNYFNEAYGDRDKYGISSWSISNALAVYVASLTSFDSPFDLYVRGETEAYSQKAYDGFNLFMGKAACGTCHFAPAFNGTVPPFYKDSESEVLGITMGYDTLHPMLDTDVGRAGNGRIEEAVDFYINSMKTVTVRNVALTAPYMHNGSFNSLEEVVRFYNKGGGAGMGLDVPHQTLPDSPLNLSKYEISALVSFMETLTDTTGMTSIPTYFPKVNRE